MAPPLPGSCLGISSTRSWRTPPQHTVSEAWDRDTLRRPADADAAFTPFVDRDIFPSASRLRWVQSPAVGVGNLMFPFSSRARS